LLSKLYFDVSAKVLVMLQLISAVSSRSDGKKTGMARHKFESCWKLNAKTLDLGLTYYYISAIMEIAIYSQHIFTIYKPQ